MAAKAKTPNFPAEMALAIATAYKAVPTPATVSKLAKDYGKSERSIVAKLVNMGVYVKAEKATAEKSATKDKIVAEIADAIGVSAEVLESLTGATKSALIAVRDALKDEAAQVAE